MNTRISSVLLGLMLGWVSLGLGFLIVRAALRWWRVRRYGPPVDHSLLLVEYGRRMARAMDRPTLRNLLTAEIPPVLQADRALLLLTQGHKLVGGELSLPVSHAAVRWVASGGKAQRSDRGRLHELIAQDRHDLAWTGAWVPLMRGIELHGLWLLGERDKQMLYAPDDLEWLTALGRQAAVVLEAAHYAERERRAASALRALYQQVVTGRELERGQLARELHDGILQDLCAVARDLKALEAQGTASESEFQDLVERSSETVTALRAICNGLRPPLLQHDLASALRGLISGLDTRSSAPVHIEVSVGDGLQLSEDASLAVFRIVQEAVNNAIQHADASEIAVRLTEYPDRLRVTVTDDGKGIPGGMDPSRFVSKGHLGLAGMQERAAMIGAKLEVQTAVDYGTVVILELEPI